MIYALHRSTTLHATGSGSIIRRNTNVIGLLCAPLIFVHMKECQKGNKARGIHSRPTRGGTQQQEEFFICSASASMVVASVIGAMLIFSNVEWYISGVVQMSSWHLGARQDTLLNLHCAGAAPYCLHGSLPLHRQSLGVPMIYGKCVIP